MESNVLGRDALSIPGVLILSKGAVTTREYASRVVETDYYSIGRVPTPEKQNAVGWRARVDLEFWPLPEPMDWTANPFNDRNWYAQFHGWRLMDPYLRGFKVTGDVRHLQRIVPWMTSWVAFLDSAPAADQSYLASLSGMRATRLALLLDTYQTGELSLTDEEVQTLYGLARRDAEWLATPDHIALMNHAYFQLFGLELLARVLAEEPWAHHARKVATKQFNRLVKSQFTDEGVHVENSPCYHHYALNQISRSGAIKNLASKETQSLLNRAVTVLPWLVFPDGGYADIGDSTGPSIPLADPGEHVILLGNTPYAVAPFWRSGYAVVRSLPDVPVECASMLLLIGASMSHIHSHADKLSFELFEFGKRIIVDTGKYGYTRDAMRSYVESAAAHNTVGLANHPISRREVTLGATELKAPRVKQDAFRLSGRVKWATKQYTFKHRRDITYRPGEYLLIRDSAKSDSHQEYASRLHFDRSLALERDGRAWLAEVNGHTMRVELLEADELTSIHHGEKDPIQGWQSVGYLQMEPATTLEVVFPGKQRTITWSITFE